MIVIVDNYDSFTFNLVQYLGEVDPANAEIQVVRNDACSVHDLKALRPDHIVLSPGPCTPNEAGISVELVRELAPEIPILGVCLGHQTIGQAFGAVVCRARRPRHGKTSPVRHGGRSLFSGLPATFTVARYHSLVVDETTLPPELEPLAWAEDDASLMALAHRYWPWCVGLQFHPESIATEHGKELLRRFLDLKPRG